METIEITAVETVNNTISILSTNIPNVVVKVIKFDEVSELREILVLDDAKLVADRGPSVRKDKVFGQSAYKVRITWASGSTNLDDIDREIDMMKLAKFMAEEMAWH